VPANVGGKFVQLSQKAFRLSGVERWVDVLEVLTEHQHVLRDLRRVVHVHRGQVHTDLRGAAVE
jgi:hypothetical protein